jgi:DNA-binding NarL/FixJ family response regulator
VRPIKILVVEDFEEFRRFVCALLIPKTEFQVTEAANGLEALRKAEELLPDLIVLDIALPRLNGLEVAKRIREFAPSTKILFLSGESSPDVVRAALNLGALGYVHKPELQSDLVPAIEAVLKGELFVSRDLKFNVRTDAPRRHEILFCSDDEVLLDGLARFIGAALNAGNAAIVWATEPHRDSLLQRLRAQGVDIDATLQRGTYIASDVTEAPDPVRIVDAIRSLSGAASKAGKKNPSVAVCGERAGRLWAEGKLDVAIYLEQLLNELAESYNIDILCVYPLPYPQKDRHAFKSLCGEHTAAYSR